MHAQHLFARNSEHAEWIMGAQIILAREGELSQIIQRLQIVGMDARRVEGLLVVRDIAVCMTERRCQPLELKRANLIAQAISTGSRVPARISSLKLRRCGIRLPEMPVSDAARRPCFKMCNDRQTEMAVGLFAAIHGHVAAEGIKRFFADTKGTPVACRAHNARAGEILNHARDRRIHITGQHDEIAYHPPLGAVALKSPTHLACRAARAPTKRVKRKFAAPGMMPSLRAGNVM